MAHREAGKRPLGTGAMAIQRGANQCWSLDFMSDGLACSHKLSILTVVDDSRECLALVADNSLSGIRVARELDRIVESRGVPCMIVSDNGTDLTSHAMLGWQEKEVSECVLYRARQIDIGQAFVPWTKVQCR